MLVVCVDDVVIIGNDPQVISDGILVAGHPTMDFGPLHYFFGVSWQS